MELLKTTCQVSQKVLFESLRVFLQNLYGEVIVNEDYLIAIGKTPIALVAHLDTVFKYLPIDIYHDKEKNVIWSPYGLGADDRAGVYSIIKILKDGYRPTVIFTTDEELGNVGAIALSLNIPDPPASLKYIIELDRQGSNDCVFYDCDNKEFINYIESFGFKQARGSFSDISDICPYWGIAGVNLSVGYYSEHSASEYLKLEEMFNTIKKVELMLEDADNISTFPYIPVKTLWKEVTCAKCKKKLSERFANEIYSPIGEKNYYCLDCAINLEVDYCKNCGNLFSNPGGKAEVCKKCSMK